jgi:hypothetical protein
MASHTIKKLYTAHENHSYEVYDAKIIKIFLLCTGEDKFLSSPSHSHTPGLHNSEGCEGHISPREIAAGRRG